MGKLFGIIDSNRNEDEKEQKVFALRAGSFVKLSP
jgi:hypothetical protein